MELHPFLLIFELRRAVALLEHELMTRLRDSGWPELTVNQVLVFAYLDGDGTTPAALARRMGMSRQSMQKNLERLGALGLVEIEPHPTDHRSRIVSFSDEGDRFASAAARLIDGFERRLEAALGTAAVNDARRVLTADWAGIIAMTQNANGR